MWCKVFVSLMIMHSVAPQGWLLRKVSHRPQDLNIQQLEKLAKMSDHESFLDSLSFILVPRVVGTPSHAKVRQYIIDKMTSLNWTVETDAFSDRTPFGHKQFTNVIATRNPDAPRHLVLACHYDSKYSRENTFVGATDSAVPCAMMINLAETMSRQLQRHSRQNDEITLRFIFFDGEEAFKKWGPSDSIYGARHLAHVMDKTPYPSGSRSSVNELKRIDLFVLLDLIGTANPTFYSYFRDTEPWYFRLVNIEKQLTKEGLLTHHRQPYFQPQSAFAGVEDDHVPFLNRNVPVLHLIPVPFPSVWHTDDDDENALDHSTIDDLNKILRAFVAEYLDLRINVRS